MTCGCSSDEIYKELNLGAVLAESQFQLNQTLQWVAKGLGQLLYLDWVFIILVSVGAVKLLTRQYNTLS